jgi:hypothetical protein
MVKNGRFQIQGWRIETPPAVAAPTVAAKIHGVGTVKLNGGERRGMNRGLQQADRDKK